MSDTELRRWAIEQSHQFAAYTGDATAEAVIANAKEIVAFVTSGSSTAP